MKKIILVMLSIAIFVSAGTMELKKKNIDVRVYKKNGQLIRHFHTTFVKDKKITIIAAEKIPYLTIKKKGELIAKSINAGIEISMIPYFIKDKFFVDIDASMSSYTGDKEIKRGKAIFIVPVISRTEKKEQKVSLVKGKKKSIEGFFVREDNHINEYYIEFELI